ncbi:MAG: DUF1667 domain-containing protein [Clostridia bacterium]|nr:DUF1667 domain-containing protein [Clostridia bacterium]
MSEKKEIVCIVCPRGCTMQVLQNGTEILVSGNQCKRGREFAIREMTAPMRTIASTVATSFPDVPVLPCRVSSEIPKDRIMDCMKEINRVRVTARVGRGDVLIPNVLGLGVDVIATSDVLKGEP